MWNLKNTKSTYNLVHNVYVNHLEEEAYTVKIVIFVEKKVIGLRSEVLVLLYLDNT